MGIQFPLVTIPLVFLLLHMRQSIIKVTVDLQGCLPKNYSYARRLYYNHRKVYIIVKLIECRIRRNHFFLRFDLMVSERKPSNAKLTLFVKLNYLPS